MRTQGRAAAAVKVLTNPVAYRVVSALGTRGAQTTTELADALNDVPASTLYRQLVRLREAGVVSVVGERQTRGAVERTYALAARDSAFFTREQMSKLPIGQPRALVSNFLARMVVDVSAYIESREFARSNPPMSASLRICELSDEAYEEAIREASAAFARAQNRSAGRKGAKRRYFYFVALPELAAP